jgi:tripartite-type tricarboxylate transporter receptor subunit TctC
MWREQRASCKKLKGRAYRPKLECGAYARQVRLVGLAVTVRVAMATIFCWSTTVQAQTVADFYRGKSIQLLMPYSGGGNYDLNARVLAQHISKHIPGRPTVIPQSLVGAGGIRLANFLYSVAPKDGTTIAMLTRGASAAPLLGNSAAQFDPRRYTWLGNISDEVSVCASWHTSKVKTFDDMLTTPFVVGTQGPTSENGMFASLLRGIFGAKIQAVSGYPAGNDVNLAMERGEVDGRCGWAWGSLKVSRPDWLTGKKVNLVLQMSLERAPDLPDTPMIMDRTRNERERQILRLIFSRQQMAWPIAAPPGLPQDRTAALRSAFEATLKDPDYLEEARQRGLEVNPTSGLVIEKLVHELYKTPDDVIGATRAMIEDRTK